MRKRLSIIVGMAAVAAAGAALLSDAPDRAGASFPGANGRIAYVGEKGIYVTGSKGHGQTRHLAGERRTAPDWSPSGHRIAYERYRDENADIYKMKANGKHKVLLTHGKAAAFDPSWSPSGKKIAFIRAAAPGNAIFKMRSNGARKRRVTPKVGPYAYAPAWSPDGDRIAYVCDFVHRGAQICTIRPDGTHRRILTDTGKSMGAPDWSPDGKRIVVSAAKRHHAERLNFHIYVMNADGSRLHRVTGKRHFDLMAVWSPDGRKLAVFRLGRGIVKMNADGGNKRLVVAGGSWPAWQPR